MDMNKALKELFNPVRAEEALKNRTLAFLSERTRGYAAPRPRRFPLYAAACACFLCVLLGGHWLYFTPVTEISIDINPSIELGVNRFGQVILVDGFNEDGQALSGALDVKYRNYTDAIQQILDNDTVAALLSGDEIMTITVSGSDGRQSARILSEIEARTREHSNTHCYSVSPEEAAAAHKMGLSCGRYRSFLELQLLDPAITPEAVLEMTMGEIQELLNSLPGGSCGGGEPGRHGHGGHGHE